MTDTATKTKSSTMKPEPSLNQSIPDFRAFSAGMMVLAEMAPERMTMSQALFFMLAGTADVAGKTTTFTDIRDAVGDKLNRSLHTTYRILMEPSIKYPKGLGWLSTETNPNDNRVKFIKLTPEGRRVMKSVLLALKGTA